MYLYEGDAAMKMQVQELTQACDKSNVSHRIPWVDYGKGLAIILVFWGHTVCPQPIRDFLYAFHMPLFYFLSGYVYNIAHYASLRMLLWRKFRTLLVPGVILGIVCRVLDYCNALATGTATDDPHIMQRAIGLVLELRGGSYWVIPWFFTSLFMVEVLAYLVFRLTRGRVAALLLIGFVSSLIGYAYCIVVGKTVPWAVETALTGLLFFLLGYVSCHAFAELFDRMTAGRMLLVWLAVTMFCSWATRTFDCTNLDIYANQYGSYPLYLMGAVAGILMAVTLCKSLALVAAKNVGRVLDYVGRNSLVFYCFNQLALAVVLEILQTCGLFRGELNLAWQSAGIIIVAIACCLCVPLVVFVNRFVPGVLGKRPIIPRS